MAAVSLLDVTGLVVVLAGLVVAGLALRRHLLRRRPGTIDVSVRLRRASHGRGWALGVGRYEDETLTWYRAVSFASRPGRTFPRAGFSIAGERRPTGPEALAMLADSVVLACVSDGVRVELAMSESALVGFRAWLLAVPPGAPPPR
ncbi:MAG: DUF2550 domain-containing protein [Mycobacteriales bacterium]